MAMKMKKKASHPMKTAASKKDGEYEQLSVQQSGKSYRVAKGMSPSSAQVQSLYGGKNKA